MATTYSQSSHSTFGRIVVQVTKEKRRSVPVIAVTGTYTGQDSSLVNRLQSDVKRQVQLPDKLKKGTYTIAAKFIIAKDGTLSDISCETDPGFGLCAAVLRVVKKFTVWTPATQAATPG